jgi:asparagine synthase (glutamine-hydrolysing)
MCGLAGKVDLRGDRVSNAAASATLEALARRGPDAQGVWHEAPCTLLHTRLRIMDVSSRSDQPFERTHRGRVLMVYNGEIYDFRALRDELTQYGWTFSTTSDSEVLLAGYMTWGSEVFRRVRGMWAAAFWHPEEQRLTLVRDPLGKKPMLYCAENGSIAFASTVSALLPLLGRTPEISHEALECYLAHLAVPFEHSIFAGIRKVPPGGIVSWTPAGGITETRYWTIPERPDAPQWDFTAEVERLLRQAVRRRLESDVPLGLFLSAGFDSGLVAALAAEEADHRLVAITAGTQGWKHDERDAARTVAERYDLEHHVIEIPPLSAGVLPLLIGELGEPFGDPSILPSYYVARAARRELTVALTGDGGDEAFFGYAAFRAVRLAEQYRRMTPSSLRAFLRRSTQGLSAEWWRRIAGFTEFGHAPLQVSYRNRAGFAAEERRALLVRNGGEPAHRAEHIYVERLRRFAALPDADALRRTFYETSLPNDYLTKVDTATMAASLEARSPFLDLDVVEFALRLSAADAYPRGRPKALLRPLVERMLPAAIRHRPKTGFGVPLGQWMRGPLGRTLEQYILREGTLFSELVNLDAARRFLIEHRRGADHARRLWGLLTLGVWCAVVVERRWAPSDSLPLPEPASASL